MDLISRQAAIDALNQIFDRCEEIEAHLPKGDPDRTGYKMYPDYMIVWKYLHQLPSAEPERKTGGWIPCSERLPERHQKVLITIYGTDVIRMKRGESFEDALARTRKNVRVSVGYHSEERWYGADGYPMIVAPIAWMPMPEPYKRGDEDGRS